MIKAAISRIKQGYRTAKFPFPETALPERFLGRPEVAGDKCKNNCDKCKKVCPVAAVNKIGSKTCIDLGRCIFCGKCKEVCDSGAISFTRDYRLGVSAAEELVVSDPVELRVKALDKEMKRIFGRSLKLRQVSAGGCSACELDTNVLNTLVYDLGRFGIQFVASPRHADGILVTGPVSKNMRLGLEKTYAAVAAPKLIIAVGACAISGGIYREQDECEGGAGQVLPVDLYIPGCPPHPITILDGLVSLLGQR